MRSIALLALSCALIAASASGKQLKELKLDLTNLDTDKVDCDSQERRAHDIIDECGLQQGNSYRHEEFAYPNNRSALDASCKRQHDAFKCLRAYSKCLAPLPKQVLNAMVSSRQKFNKKICVDKANDFSNSFIEMGQCMSSNKDALNKAIAAEITSIIVPESIVGTKIDSLKERIKQSCCSVAKVRRDYMDAVNSFCSKHNQVASEVIDSYLAETVGIICPTLPGEDECNKLPKLNTPSKSHHNFFVMPILDVIKTLSPN